MFEAHQPTADLSSIQSSHQDSSIDEQIVDKIIYSKTHSCPLRVWSSHGKRKDNSGNASTFLFLYIEYKNINNDSCYLCKELASELLLDQQFLVMLAESVLLKDISAKKTLLWLDETQRNDE
ncbi:hypothetical protein [Neptunomonas sp.]|uniref:hypothetical protein n=1 Tax=Neptunomonas sp. TaxID=1971898 RepID=UPI0025FE2DC2|nr:hypothetical protein [Neptunomonas sp.]